MPNPSYPLSAGRDRCHAIALRRCPECGGPLDADHECEECEFDAAVEVNACAVDPDDDP